MFKTRVLTPKMMLKADQDTLKRENITSFELMLRASKALAKTIIKHKLMPKEAMISILCGPGNNGGDGACLGHFLAQDYPNITLIYPSFDASKNPLSQNLQTLEALPKRLSKFIIDSEIESHLKNADVIIDALFGISLDRPLEGIYKDLVELANQQEAIKISLDMPSGIHPYSGVLLGAAFKADYTLVIQAYKTGNLLLDAPDYQGKTYQVEADIQANDKAKQHYLASLEEVLPFLRPRKANIHKYDQGSSLIIGGSKGMEGAPLLSALGAYRSGAGLVKILRDKAASNHHHCPPEIQMESLSLDTLKIHLKKKDAILFGVGLGKDKAYSQVLKKLLDDGRPLIIDADGIAHLKEVLLEYHDLSHVLITPHIGELANLVDLTSAAIRQDPFTPLKKLVETHQLNILLKGPSSVFINQAKTIHLHTPNPALAKGGSGDVLAGIILSLLSKKIPIDSAACKAVFLLQQSVNHLLKTHHEASILPTDVIKGLSSALFVLK